MTVNNIDFLPEWCKESSRQRLHVRRQYIALVAVFLAMITYNLVAAQKIARTAAAVARFEGSRLEAEEISHQFNTVTTTLNKVRAKADLIERIDSKINVAAVLAEMSHILGETIVLNQLEFVAEPFTNDDKGQRAAGAGVRIAGSASDASPEAVLGNVRFRILLTGVAANPADVAALICRLDGSAYFRQVSASFWRSGKIQRSVRTPQSTGRPAAGAGSGSQGETLEVTEFGITCYLANYQEGKTP
jgi:hypothetical protein